MTEKEYRQSEGISKSALFRMTESPEKFKWALDNPEPPTPALVFGQFVHKLILEPETVDDEFIVAPTVDKRTKEGKAMWVEFMGLVKEGQQIIDSGTCAVGLEMRRVAQDSPYVKRLLKGEHELPMFWTDELTGEKCKARLDCLTEIDDKLVIVDYKTTADASTDAFMRSAVKYGYDLQAAMYCEAVKKNLGKDPTFVFIAQEKDPPYSVNIMQADEVFVRRGADLFRELIGIYHDCKKTGNWYGYLGPYNMINNLALPAWLAKEVE